MASLTATLDSPSQGKGIVSAPKPGPSIISSLAEPVVGFLNGLDNHEIRSRQNKIFQRQQGEKTVTGIAEQALFDELNKAENDLRKSKAAVGQGKAPSGSFDVKFDSVLNDLTTKFPDYKDVIFETFYKRGYNHWQFREMEANKKAEEAQATSLTKADDDAYQAAFRSTRYNPTASYEDNVVVGRTILQEDADWERLHKRNEEKRAAEAAGRSTADFDEKQGDREAFGVINGVIQNEMNAWMPTLRQLIDSAKGNPSRQKLLSELSSQIPVKINQMRSYLKTKLGPSATKDRIDFIDNELDKLQTDVTTMFNGDVQATNRTLQIIENGFKIDQYSSLNLYSRLSKAFGSGAVVDSLFDGQKINFPPDIQKKMLAEIAGLNTNDAQEGRAHIMRLVGLLKGDTTLKDMTSEEARAQMPTLASQVQNGWRPILSGKADDSQKTAFRSSYGNLVEAAGEIAPGTRDASAVWTGARILFSPWRRSAVDALIKDSEHKEQATAIALASHGVAQHVLDISRNMTTPMPEYQSIRFNPRTEEYEVQFDQKKFGDWVSRNRGGPARPTLDSINPGAVVNPRTVDKATLDKVSSMNASLQHLIEYAKYDDSIPKGVTRKQLVEHYVNNKPFVTANGKTMLTADQEFEKVIGDFKKAMTEDISEPPPNPISDIKFSSPIDAAVRTIFAEDPNNAIGVLSTIWNRSGGKLENFESTVLANDGKVWQYSPWGDAKATQRALGLSSTDPKYLKILEEILPYIQGRKPMESFTHFFSPQSMVPEGRVPSWAEGKQWTTRGATNFLTLP